MKRIIVMSLLFSLLLCGCGLKNEDNKLESIIKDNMEKILKENQSSSNPYDYVNTLYYKNIVKLGEDAVPVLIKMHEDGKLSYDGLDSYVASIAVQEITNCSLFDRYHLSYSIPSEFFELWKTHNCGFQPYGIDYDVTLEVKDNSITNYGATFILKNNTDNVNWYGPEYSLEKKENGKWVDVDTLDGEPLVWNTIAYKLEGFEIVELNIDWSFGYGALEKGEYRIFKSFIRDVDRPIEEYDKVYLYARFSI